MYLSHVKSENVIRAQRERSKFRSLLRSSCLYHRFLMSYFAKCRVRCLLPPPSSVVAACRLKKTGGEGAKHGGVFAGATCMAGRGH